MGSFKSGTAQMASSRSQLWSHLFCVPIILSGYCFLTVQHLSTRPVMVSRFSSGKEKLFPSHSWSLCTEGPIRANHAMGHGDWSRNGLRTQSEPTSCWKHLTGAAGDQLSHFPAAHECGGCEAGAAGVST